MITVAQELERYRWLMLVAEHYDLEPRHAREQLAAYLWKSGDPYLCGLAEGLLADHWARARRGAPKRWRN